MKFKLAISIYYLLQILAFSQTKNDSVCPRIGLVLSGGGAKGYAHVGVLKVLEKNHIYPNIIGGTSMGAIIGGVYASGYTAQQLDSVIYATNFDAALLSSRDRNAIPFFDRTYSEKYLVQLPIEKFKIKIPRAIAKSQGTIKTMFNLTRHVQNVTDFNDLSTPFFAIATDLVSGNQVVLDHGSLGQSLLASGALPGLVEPQKIEGKVLVDGGVVNNFPSKEIREKGADIVIGSDVLDNDTLDPESLQSITSVIQRLSMLKGKQILEEQKKNTNVYIDVDISGYGITDFNQKQPLIERGEVSAEQHLPEIFKLIPEHCRTDKDIRTIKHKINENDSLMLSSIALRGLKSYTNNYVLNKLKLDVPEKIPYTAILSAVDRLYGTGNFEKVQYFIENTPNGKRIIFEIEENRYKSFIKAGLHYDDVYKTGVLFNFTRKNLFWKDSYLSLDVVLGDRLRANVNYFIDNGSYPSVGLNYSYKTIRVNNLEDNEYLAKGSYGLVNHNAQFFVQSTLKNRYAIGVGAEYDYFRIKEDDVILGIGGKKILESYYLGPYAYLKVDDRNQPNFTRKGIVGEAKVKYLALSSDSDYSPAVYLKANAEISLPLMQKLVLKIDNALGFDFSEAKLPVGQQFYLGGMNEQPLLNGQKMPGYDFYELRGNNYFLNGIGLQYNFYKNSYVTAFGYKANIADSYTKLNYFNVDEYNALGVSLGYDSIIGPLKLTYTFSPTKKENNLYLSVGFWF